MEISFDFINILEMQILLQEHEGYIDGDKKSIVIP